MYGKTLRLSMTNAPETLTMPARLRRWAKTIKRDVHALYFATKHPRVPWYAKLAAALGITGWWGYATWIASP